MKTASVLRDEIHEHRAELDTMVQTSELEIRDLTQAESVRCDDLIQTIHSKKDQLAIVEKVQAEKMSRMVPMAVDRINQQRAENGLGPIGGGHSSPQMKVDSKGNRYAILGRGDKATDIYRPPCQNALGHYVIGRIFGVTRSTPEAVRMAMSTNDNSAGGFAVPSPLAGQIIDLVRAKSVMIRAGVRTAILESGSLLIPVLESDTTNTVKAENSAFGDSQIVLGGRSVELKTAGCVITMSRELAEDSADLLAQQLETFLANSLASQIDGWGLTGAPPNPLGLMTRFDLTGSSQIQSTGSVGTIDWTDVIAAAVVVRGENFEPNACVLSPTVHSALFSTESGDGVNSARNWLDVPPVLRDVEFLQTTHAPNSKLVIGQFDQHVFAMRSSPLVEVSTSAGNAFQNHQVLVKISQRVDYVPLRTEAFYGLSGIS